MVDLKTTYNLLSYLWKVMFSTPFCACGQKCKQMYVFLIYLWFGHRNILVAQRISWKMASRVSKQVDASQRFLRGLQSLPSFAETRAKQAEQLLATVERVQNFTVEEANKVLEIFSESLWGPDLSERFKAQLSARTNLIQPSACGRRPLQNYLALPRYLTQSLWASLQGSEPEELRLEKLVRHAARLGLRCPTEPTFAMLLALSFQGARTEQKQRQVLSEHKPRIKRWLNEPSPADYLEVLPEDVNLLPASLVAAAFGQDPRVDCPLDEKLLLGVAMQWPLRQRQSSGSMLAAPTIPTWQASTIGPFLSGIAAASAYAAHWGSWTTKNAAANAWRLQKLLANSRSCTKILSKTSSVKLMLRVLQQLAGGITKLHGSHPPITTIPHRKLLLAWFSQSLSRYI